MNLVDCALTIVVLNYPCICCKHIGSVMSKNVLEVDLEYVEVARSTRRMSSLLVFPKTSLTLYCSIPV